MLQEANCITHQVPTLDMVILCLTWNVLCLDYEKLGEPKLRWNRPHWQVNKKAQYRSPCIITVCICGQMKANVNRGQHAGDYTTADWVGICGIYKTVFRCGQPSVHGLHAFKGSYEWEQNICRLQCFIIVSKLEQL